MVFSHFITQKEYNAIKMYPVGILVISLALTYQANAVEAIYHKQGQSYFNRLEDFANHRQLINRFKSDPTFKNEVNQVLGQLSGIPNLLQHVGSDYHLQEKQSFGESIPLYFDDADFGNDTVGNFTASGVVSALMSVLDQYGKSSQCVKDLVRIIREVVQGHPWTLQMLDSIGKPGPSITQGRLNFVGNLDQCRDVYAPPAYEMYSAGFKGAYTPMTMMVNVAGLMPGMNSVPATIGLCLPDTCSSLELFTMLNATVYQLGLNGTVTPLMPETLTGETEFTTATYLSIGIISFIALLMLVGTVYDLTVIQWPIWEEEKRKVYQKNIENEGERPGDTPPPYNGVKQNGNTHGNYGNTPYDNKAFHVEVDGITDTTDDALGQVVKSPTENSMNHNGIANGVNKQVNSTKDISTGKRNTEISAGGKLLLAFSVYTNTTKFLSTAQPPSAITAIHGIRFFSMSWVLLGHTIAFGQTFFANPLDVQGLVQTWPFDAISNALVSVDTFFALAGLLTAYLTVREMKKLKTWKINWGLFYFHRYWRLTPPYMLTLLIVLGMSQFLGSGPMWANKQPADREQCEDNWWTNIVYINNLYKADKMCFGHAWYLANDMQFFVVSPLMIVPFFFSPVAGIVSCSVFFLSTTIYTGIMSVQNEWPSTFVGAAPTGMNSWFFDYYVVPWGRVGPYIVGVMTGALLATKSVRLNHRRNLLGWAVAAATGLACVYGLNGDLNGEHLSSVGAAALYNAVARSAWGASVCWVIVSCHLGYGGFINSVLSWSAFVPLGRLTYMAYLVHPSILYAFYQNLGTLLYINNFTIIMTYFGTLVLVNMAAFVFMLGLEAPMIGMEKALLPQRKR